MDIWERIDKGKASSILQIDDLDVGMFITVLNGDQTFKEFMGPQGSKTEINEKNAYYKGKVLRVVSMNLPYIFIEYYGSAHNQNDLYSATIDIREANFIKLDRAFIKTASPNFGHYLRS